MKVCVFGGQQEGAGLLPFGGRTARSHETEVTDADKAVGEDVEEKAADELLRGQPDESVGPGLLIVACAEGHRIYVQGDDALVGDGGAVGVLAEVAEDMLWAEEGRFGIGVPFDFPQAPDESFEGWAGFQVSDALGEENFSVLERLLEAVEKLSPEQVGQSADGYQEVVSCRDPLGAVLAEAPGGDHDVQVDVGEQVLVPCVQDRGEAGQSVEPGPPLGQLEQRLGCGLKEEVVKERLVLEEQGAELVRQGEHHMEVSSGQEPLAALGDPADFLQALTLGAMPIPAGVEGPTFITASVFAGFQVPSPGGGPALEDVADDLALLAAHGVVLHVRFGVDTKDIAELGRGVCRSRQTLVQDYFFGLHGLPPSLWSFWRASQGLSMVCRKALLTWV